MLSQGLKEHVAGNVRRFRTHHGWSLSELGRRAQVDPGTVRNVEAGGNVTLSTLLAIADALGISLEVLLFDGYERQHHVVEVMRADDAPVMDLGSRLVRHLVEAQTPSWIRLSHLQLRAGKTWRSDGHDPGSIERLFVLDGRIELGPATAAVTAATGDFVSFWADLPHIYRPLGGSAAGILLSSREVVVRPDPAG